MRRTSSKYRIVGKAKRKVASNEIIIRRVHSHSCLDPRWLVVPLEESTCLSEPDPDVEFPVSEEVRWGDVSESEHDWKSRERERLYEEQRLLALKLMCESLKTGVSQRAEKFHEALEALHVSYGNAYPWDHSRLHEIRNLIAQCHGHLKSWGDLIEVLTLKKWGTTDHTHICANLHRRGSAFLAVSAMHLRNNVALKNNADVVEEADFEQYKKALKVARLLYRDSKLPDVQLLWIAALLDFKRAEFLDPLRINCKEGIRTVTTLMQDIGVTIEDILGENPFTNDIDTYLLLFECERSPSVMERLRVEVESSALSSCCAGSSADEEEASSTGG